MARRRTMDRKTLREQSDAAEARETDEDAVAEDEEEEDEEEEAEEGDGADDEGGGDDDEDAPKPKKAKAKKKAEPKPKAKTPTKRTRAVKEVRMKAIWVVFDNSGKRVKEFPYPKKSDAEALLAEKIEEKKGTFYIQLVKEPLEA